MEINKDLVSKEFYEFMMTAQIQYEEALTTLRNPALPSDFESYDGQFLL